MRARWPADARRRQHSVGIGGRRVGCGPISFASRRSCLSMTVDSGAAANLRDADAEKEAADAYQRAERRRARPTACGVAPGSHVRPVHTTGRFSNRSRTSDDDDFSTVRPREEKVCASRLMTKLSAAFCQGYEDDPPERKETQWLAADCKQGRVCTRGRGHGRWARDIGILPCCWLLLQSRRQRRHTVQYFIFVRHSGLL